MTWNYIRFTFILSCRSSFFSRCPFLLNLDLIGIANRFAQFNLPAFALGTLLLIPCATKKAQQIQVCAYKSIQQKELSLLPKFHHSVSDHHCFLLFFAVTRAFCRSVTQSLSLSRWRTSWTLGNWLGFHHRLDVNVILYHVCSPLWLARSFVRTPERKL